MGGGGGGGVAVSSRPLDKGEAGLPKKIFRPFGPQFGLKLSGGGGGGAGAAPQASPLDPPLISYPESSGFLVSAAMPGQCKFCIPRRPRDEHDCEANAGHLLCTNKNKRR